MGGGALLDALLADLVHGLRHRPNQLV